MQKKNGAQIQPSVNIAEGVISSNRPGSRHLAALGKAIFWRPAYPLLYYYATNTSNNYEVISFFILLFSAYVG